MLILACAVPVDFEVVEPRVDRGVVAGPIPSVCYTDTDGDGHGGDGGQRWDLPCTGDEVEVGGDCDDGRAEVYPGAPERCDGLDDDCDGLVDSPLPADAPTWYTDGDGYGDAAVGEVACDPPAGWVAQPGDCDDDDPLRSPGLAEVCGDDLDNDCANDGDAHCPVVGEVSVEDLAGATWYASTDRARLTPGAVSSRGWMLATRVVEFPSLGWSSQIHVARRAGDGGDIDDADLVLQPSEIGYGAFSGSGPGFVGDLDGDGCDDVFAGGERESAPAGTAWLFAGCDTGTISVLDAWAAGDGDDADRFGHSAACTGGDASSLVVGAPGDVDDARGNGAHRGQAYAFTSPGTSLDAAGATAVLSLPPGAGELVLGWELAACDIDGDGVGEVILGAPGYGTDGAVMPGWAPGGAVFVAYGPLDANRELVDEEGRPDAGVALVAGAAPDLGVGEGLACADLDGDGRGDVLHHAYALSFLHAGVYVPEVVEGGAVEATGSGWSISADASLGLGSGGAITGDIDGDGSVDVALTGDVATYLFYGPFSGSRTDADADAILVGGRAGAAGDTDGDGRSDLLLGDPYADHGATDGGVVWVLFGGSR